MSRRVNKKNIQPRDDKFQEKKEILLFHFRTCDSLIKMFFSRRAFDTLTIIPLLGMFSSRYKGSAVKVINFYLRTRYSAREAVLYSFAFAPAI